MDGASAYLPACGRTCGATFGPSSQRHPPATSQQGLCHNWLTKSAPGASLCAGEGAQQLLRRTCTTPQSQDALSAHLEGQQLARGTAHPPKLRLGQDMERESAHEEEVSLSQMLATRAEDLPAPVDTMALPTESLPPADEEHKEVQVGVVALRKTCTGECRRVQFLGFM